MLALALAASAYAIPNTFSDGDIVSAEKMNENFQALINSNVLRSTTVNCDDGETINGAIEKGFNDIMVKGTCKENLRYTVWREDTAENRQPSGKLAPRFLKISGVESTNATIEDTSANADSLVIVKGGTTLFLKDIALSGGEYSVAGQRNANVYLSNVLMSGFGFSAITIADSAFLGIDEQGVEIDGNDMGDNGIVIGTGSSGWVNNVKISGVRRGIYLIGGSMLWFQNEMSIDSSEIGVDIYNSRFMNFQEPNLTIQGPSDFAIRTHQGDIKIDSGSTSINNIGGRGIDLWQSKASINNLKLLDFNNTGTGWNPALEISGGSSVYINGAEITGSTDSALVSIEDGSIMEIRDSTLTVGSAAAGIEASGSSRLMFRNSTISGSVANSLVAVSDVSSSKIQDSTIILESGQRALDVVQSSVSRIENSNLSGTATNELVSVGRVSNVVIKNGSNLSQTNSESPDVALARLSFLTVWADGGTSIGKVHCWYKSSVSADEGTVADLDPSCIEEGADSPAPGSLDDLQGTWKTACQADGTSFSSQSLEVGETNATFTVNIYPDSNCTTAVAQFTSSISNMTVGGRMNLNDGSVGYKVNYIQGSLTLTPLNTEMSDQFNQYGYCGITSWANGVSTEINGRTCDSSAQPLKNTTFLNTYKLIGTNLFLGDGSALEYPPTVDSDPFVKQ